MSNIQFFEHYSQKIKLFHGLSADEIAHIMRQGTMMEFRSGENIFHKGQLGNSLFIVLHGKVNITINGRRIGLCKIGDAFGEMSVLNHRPHTASADAATNVQVFILHEQQLNRILQQHVAARFLMNVIHVLSSHLENANITNTKKDLMIRRLTDHREVAAAVG